MAANVSIDEGSDKSIGTFEVGGVQIQAVALVDSVGGKGTPLPVDATYGIPADIKRVPALPIAQDSVTFGGVAYTVQQVAVDAATSGDANTIVAAVSGKRYRVLSVHLYVDSSVTIAIKDGTDTLIAAMTVGTSLIINPRAGYVCQCNGTNRPLKLTLGGAVNVRGLITYIELTA